MDYMTSNQLLGPEEDHKLGQQIARTLPARLTDKNGRGLLIFQLVTSAALIQVIGSIT